MRPDNYKRFDGREWTFPGKLAGSAQPGYYSDKSQDEMLIKALKSGKTPEEAGVDKLLLEHLDGLYAAGVNTIYSLAHFPGDRNPELIKLIWERKFPGNKYITEIDDVDIGIEDFHAPTQEQIEKVTQDAIARMKAGENILVHCGAGIGRTGTILAAIEMASHNSHNVENVIQYIRNNYNYSAVEGENQKKALEEFGITLQKAAIKVALSRGSTLEEKNNALASSFSLGLSEQAITLIKNGAEVETALKQANKKGINNALQIAVELEDSKLAIRSINAGANVNISDPFGNSLFSTAIATGNVDLYRAIYQSPTFNLEEKDKQGKSPIMCAIELQNFEMIKDLVMRGADLKEIKQTDIDSTKLQEYFRFAIEHDNYKAIKNLLEFQPSLYHQDIDGMSPLQYALQQNKEALYVEMVSLDLETDSEVAKESKRIATSFLKNKPEKLKKIILDGANISYFENGHGELSVFRNYHDYELSSYLKEAIDSGNIEIIRNLLKFDANVVHYGVNGKAALRYAAENNQYDLALNMAEIGFKVGNRSASKNADHALELAVEFNLPAKAEKYLSEGANVHKISLCDVIDSKKPEMVKLLIKHGANINGDSHRSPLTHAIKADNAEILDFMISQPNIDLGKESDNQKIPLMVAVAVVSPSIIKKLIDHGADINQKNSDGRTALMEAAILKKPAILEILIDKYNADVNLVDGYRRTALMQAESPKIIEILIKKGADVNAVDANGRTALKIAIDNREKEIAAAIIKEAATYGNIQTLERMALDIGNNKENLFIMISAILARKDLNITAEMITKIVNSQDQGAVSLATSAVIENKDRESAKLLSDVLKKSGMQVPDSLNVVVDDNATKKSQFTDVLAKLNDASLEAVIDIRKREVLRGNNLSSNRGDFASSSRRPKYPTLVH